MTRPKTKIPFEDIKGLKTLLAEGKTQDQIVEYYLQHGINVNQATISRRIHELEGKEK